MCNDNPKNRAGDWFQTYTGKKFWPLDPRPEDFDIRDIAHALSLTSRFGGHTRAFYSVAQHSHIVSKIVPPEFAFAGLMHDATEAYLGDMVRPLKNFMPAYRDVEKHLWSALAARFNLPEELPPCVKHADNVALITERRDLLLQTGHSWGEYLDNLPFAALTVHPVQPIWAERSFLMRYEELHNSPALN